MKGIAAYLHSADIETSVFYTSNVEGSLQGPRWRQFYTNIELLLFDSRSVILRVTSGPSAPEVCSAQNVVEEFKSKCTATL